MRPWRLQRPYRTRSYRHRGWRHLPFFETPEEFEATITGFVLSRKGRHGGLTLFLASYRYRFLVLQRIHLRYPPVIVAI